VSVHGSASSLVLGVSPFGIVKLPHLLGGIFIRKELLFHHDIQACFAHVCSLYLHMVRITEYRKKLIESAVAHRVGEMMREQCTKDGIEIMAGHVSRDHVHPFVSILLHATISRPVQCGKGKMSGMFL